MVAVKAISSTRWAAVSTMCPGLLQEEQTPRPLHDMSMNGRYAGVLGGSVPVKATRKSWPHSAQQARANR
ncbi:MAG: hypothetical protein AAES65_00990 [Candidatus Thiodiazotropha sp. (ex. Lucinoma kazani)]